MELIYGGLSRCRKERLGPNRPKGDNHQHRITTVTDGIWQIPSDVQAV